MGLLGFIILFFTLNLIGTILICLCIITPPLFSFIIYKLGVYTKTNYKQLHNNLLCVIVALAAFSTLFILVSIIFIYYGGLSDMYSYLSSLDGNFLPSYYLLEDDGLRNPLRPEYNVLTRRDAGEKIGVEACCFWNNYLRVGTLSEIGLYGNGIYSREFRHVLPFVEA
jgi:hypothetical protein